MPRRCVAIGASAGGLEPLRDVLKRLPAAFPAPVLVAVHVRPSEPSLLPSILGRAGPLTAKHPADGELMEDGVIYIAPPDRHLMIDDGHLAVRRGPKENGFRPSIDVLFRSAAYTFGPHAIGVVLSGSLNDGTSGLWSIKRLGGMAIIQDPSDARFGSMPKSALEYVEADYKIPSSAIGELLGELARDPAERPVVRNLELDDELKTLAVETQFAAGTSVPQRAVLDLGPLTPFTCPECHGSLVEIAEGHMARFRCHTGHGFTQAALLDRLSESVREKLWETTRGLQETELLLEHIGGHLAERGQPATAKRFFAKAHEIGRKATRLQRDAIEQEALGEAKLSGE
jgi:two-component system chemotaxis response regulator CheB